LKIITSLRQILANLSLDAYTFNDICYLKSRRVKCNHYFKPSTQYKKHAIDLSLALNCGVWGKIFVTPGDRAHILKTRIIMYITIFHERQSSPRVIKITIQGTKARSTYM
jgi:hypothetical protein